MMARNRPRQSFKTEDFPDEQQLWGSIVEKIKKANLVNRKLVDVKAKIAAAEEDVQNEESPRALASMAEELERLNRAGVKLAEEELKILNDEPDDLLKNLETLMSVRAAFEVDAPRPTPSTKSRNLKRRHDADSNADSPAPVQDLPTPGPNPRAVGKATSRSGSVAAGSVATPSDKPTPKFPVDSEVFFRCPGEDGLGYLAKIVGVINDKGVRKYKVKDIDPESKDAPAIASADKLMAIPPEGTQLPALSKGKEVYAVYPNTTTIYNAKLVSQKRDVCKLIFENDDDQETDVIRRHVLEPSSGYA